uniref:Uncharacterized protein n=1 Tax=Arundo donax TaxID=35708 RepID=A0A0A9DP39_ARUDO
MDISCCNTVNQNISFPEDMTTSPISTSIVLENQVPLTDTRDHKLN